MSTLHNLHYRKHSWQVVASYALALMNCWWPLGLREVGEGRRREAPRGWRLFSPSSLIFVRVPPRVTSWLGALLGEGPWVALCYARPGGVEQWSARQAHNLEVAGSNPASAPSLTAMLALGVMTAVWVLCRRCGLPKAPRGRSVPAAMYGGLCGADRCPGYDQNPQPDCRWPGEDCTWPEFVVEHENEQA